MSSSSPDSAPQSIAARLAAVQARMAAAAREAGRDPADVTLVAVTKTQPWGRVKALIEAGQTVFGENRVQEADDRWGASEAEGLAGDVRLIGPLQTNKAEAALARFDVIETVDRDRLAEALARAADKLGKRPRVLVQVNTGEEPQKAGIAPRDADAFIARVRDVHGLSVEGLMAIPPVDEAPGPHFALLAKIARRNGLPVLSMGMSGDFETAIRLGATHVRVGTALFGERDPG
ncbi:YggS family pyridoxal phosphate-dependent enzyme [Brevundimonas sp. A19_0]|uniref:YggS family pyridoxal phosphate-dependent enzyme n=1 Tax=Brevundimonas sp. A19_0 TaxID=2821087 RepID=UPI001ADB7C67|nr:YggS family pyridoxal phosphate-dependent enzyme [Brevundimonas sp. A19_0]MBO9501897.1 YggS family pyridoxal phosphate-dependent enzyme [Brevundimonas sp. A19_0]